jgi:modulator of FtsH protease HflK
VREPADPAVVATYRGEVVTRAQIRQQIEAIPKASSPADTRRFADLVMQYQRDAQTFGLDVTRYRLYVETMEQILPKAKKYIVEPGENGEKLNLRILEQLPAALPTASGRP